MAKQDLYKTAQQSAKLFKLIQDEQLLESWVKNKIISAAEDISTVYQYLNYEKQFKDYSQMIAESTDLSESKRALLTSKLAEAKEKVKELKKKAAKEKSEKMDENAFDTKAKGDMKVGDTKKTRTGELTKTSTGVVHKNTSYHDDGEAEDKSGKGIKSHAKAKSASEKKAEAPAQKKSKTGTWGMENGQKFDNRKDEGTYLGKKLTAEGKLCPICKKDPCICGKGDKKKKTVKETTLAEKDMGKHNNGKTTGFKAVAAKAAKEYGSKAAGERVAGAVKAKMAKAGKLEEAEKELKGGQKKLDQNHNGHLDADDFAKLRAKKKVKEAISRAKEVLEGKGKPKWLEKAEVEAEEKEGKKVSKKEEKKVGIVKESAELDRLKALTQHLNG